MRGREAPSAASQVRTTGMSPRRTETSTSPWGLPESRPEATQGTSPPWRYTLPASAGAVSTRRAAVRACGKETGLIDGKVLAFSATAVSPLSGRGLQGTAPASPGSQPTLLSGSSARGKSSCAPPQERLSDAMIPGANISRRVTGALSAEAPHGAAGGASLQVEGQKRERRPFVSLHALRNDEGELRKAEAARRQVTDNWSRHDNTRHDRERG